MFGTIVSGRPPEVKGVESIVGLFINAVPVRYQPAPDKSFAELVKECSHNGVGRKLMVIPFCSKNSLSP
ncbi:condensation domain-containing protein [Lysinibacillus sphaericus]